MRATIVLALAVSLFTQLMMPVDAAACRIDPYRQARYELDALCEAIQRYEREIGPLKHVSEDGTVWFDALLAAEVGDYYFLPQLLMRRPVSVFNMEVVYDPSGAVRCVGPNGVDDGGKVDDWEVRYSPEYATVDLAHPKWNVWYADEYDAARSRGALRGLLVAVLGIVIGLTLHRWFLAAVAATMCYGALFVNISATETAVFRWPYWVELTQGTATIAVVVSVGTFLIWGLVLMARAGERTVNAAGGKGCANCGYCLEGLSNDVCPECGELIRSNEMRDVQA